MGSSNIADYLVDGSIQFNDLSEDVTMKVDVDELTGSAAREVIDE